MTSPWNEHIPTPNTSPAHQSDPNSTWKASTTLNSIWDHANSADIRTGENATALNSLDAKIDSLTSTVNAIKAKVDTL
ncbi:MAG: hypothetical protein WCA46_16915 [Actinocatenispora sp.]